LVLLIKPIDTIGEENIDDLATCVKHVVLGDWFWGWHLVFKGGGWVMLTQYFRIYISPG
jgi:hypothetical protein